MDREELQKAFEFKMKLYVEKPDKFEQLHTIDYFLNEIPDIKTVEHGYILPIKMIDGYYRGGY